MKQSVNFILMRLASWKLAQFNNTCILSKQTKYKLSNNLMSITTQHRSYIRTKLEHSLIRVFVKLKQ